MNAAAQCWLCDRPLGVKIEWHHPIPRAKGGRETLPVHPICHRAIHASLSNGQLARMGADVEALRGDPGIVAFLRWVANKPPDFHAPTRARRGLERFQVR